MWCRNFWWQADNSSLHMFSYLWKFFTHHYRHTQKAEELIKAQQAKKNAQTTSQSSTQSTSQQQNTSTGSAAADVVDDGQVSADWTYDPNEPRYCLCNQVSYGEMVGCDNDDVSWSSVIHVPLHAFWMESNNTCWQTWCMMLAVVIPQILMTDRSAAIHTTAS